MSTLTGPEIFAAIARGEIYINPMDPKLVNAHSVDLHLGSSLKRYSTRGPSWSDATYPKHSPPDNNRERHPGCPTPWDTGPCLQYIDSKHPPELCDVPLQAIPTRRDKEPGWFLEPGTLYLGTTLEYTETRGYRPVLDGRSSTGRLGAFMHITAGYGDNGFRGYWTLEIAVIEPLILYPGQRLLQISYETLHGKQTFYGETENSSGTYQDHPAEPIGSKSSLDDTP